MLGDVSRMSGSARQVTSRDLIDRIPIYAVWEITLACDLKCIHCGSRAGRKRQNELTTAEALEVVSGLARLGTREVTLIGGEAYLRRDWLKIIEAITDAGMDCGIQSGGRFLTKQRIRDAALAGAKIIGISIDGVRSVHDRQRGVQGSFDAATRALVEAHAAGLATHANSQINTHTLGKLDEIFEHLRDLEVSQWLVQLTVAMGRAADTDIMLQPWQMVEVMPKLAELAVRSEDRGPQLQLGNNVGYFGPHEAALRGNGDRNIHWKGCSAGHLVIALEADGTVKGCPSLPTRSYSGGNVRDLPVDAIWSTSPSLDLSRADRSQSLWGLCRTCRYRYHCAAGCTWTSHSTLGRPGNNPFCHHRALRLSQRNLRERLVLIECAPGESFDHGKFEIVIESSDDGRRCPPPDTLDEMTVPENALLVPCRACNEYGDASRDRCEFCNAVVLNNTEIEIAAAAIKNIQALLA